ncbi:MAG TPA: hypothetical protein VD793_07650, partial [Gemmatimonadales bacterium]|nr:hypothetical protein [Gemmatimonadales bacterium]
LDGDVRRIPLDLALGLTDWLTVTARVSLVKTRMQAFVSLDSTQGNVGWNQALSLAENPTGATQITTLLTGLAASVVALEQQVGSGGFGCPGSASCDSAMAALARAQRLLTGLNTLSAASSPVMPLSASPAGVGLLQEIGRVRSELAGLGLPAFGGALVLPGQSLTASGFQTLIGAPEFGHALLPLATTDISRLGDTELGARVGIIQRPAFRVALHGTARLPTAARDSINHAVDLGTGDRQLDAAVGLEAALEGPGGLGLAGGAVFTRQFADQLTLRVPRAWALPSGTEGTFRRDLGDVWQLGAYPSLRLNNAFRVFGSVYYYRKAADSYQYLGPALPNVPSQEQDGAEQALHFGAGLYYRADRTSGGTVRLPVEAGLTYQAAFRGSGAHVPKTTMINMYLRLHYRVFGGAAPPEGPGQT